MVKIINIAADEGMPQLLSGQKKPHFSAVTDSVVMAIMIFMFHIVWTILGKIGASQ